MAKIPYSDFVEGLDPAATLDGTELIAVIQDGAPVQTTAQDIADLGGGGASYLKYVALLTQIGTDAPVATALENTLGGTVVWSYNSVGDFTGTLAAAFTANKTGCLIAETGGLSFLGRVNDNEVHLVTRDEVGNNINEYLLETMVEIRVYP